MATREIIAAIALLAPSEKSDSAKKKWAFIISIDFESLASCSEKTKEEWYVFWVRKDGEEDNIRIDSTFISFPIDPQNMIFDNKGRLMMALKIKNTGLAKAPVFYYSLSTKYDIRHYAVHRNNSSGGERILVDFRSEKAEYYEKLRLGIISDIEKNRINNYLHASDSFQDISQSDLDTLESSHVPLGKSLPSFDLGKPAVANSLREKQNGRSEIEKLQKIQQLELANCILRNQLNTYKSKQDSDNRMRNAVVSADVSKLEKEHTKVKIKLAAASRENENLKKENECAKQS